ncbi:MAG: hypothetical protein RLZZ232_2059, partial [Planctomycetota bacterium]
SNGHGLDLIRRSPLCSKNNPFFSILPAMATPHDTLLSGLTLVRTRRARVRELKGFRKSHQLPTEYNDHTAAFVARIAADDLSEDLEQRFADFRRQLQCRRTELIVSDPESGVAAINTPWFEYRVSATLASDDTTEVEWRWQLSDFRDPPKLSTPEVTQAFHGFFDTVELLPTQPVDPAELIDQIEERQVAGVVLDYDRKATWCTLQIKGISATLTVSGDLLSLHLHQPASPGKLIESFLQMHGEFIARPRLR